ncbi:MAG TPA: hypothetical protein VN714_17200 [Trebonia sp.]|nr:hypothetical protein [Trebonia sp.]
MLVIQPPSSSRPGRPWRTKCAARKKAERDVRRAEAAEEAVGFAIAAVQEAEYAVLQAALARADADALTGAS